ncbi:MAG: SRPBCC domain-containing protein [Planctomycetes bacterium]|nr:SRPBCC domain-containing protein [Planctomycetota bacterium]MCB9829246.1 SRPBCC domain-containing protein [Planctomycetota bacterium]MCB9902594.1 SRPBCC domain-containing protein [Planctomycetota bacterium]
MPPTDQSAEGDATNQQVYRITIRATPQKVWDAFVKEGEVLPFLFNSVLHTTRLAPGAPIRMRSPDGKTTGVVGEVLEIDPPHRYVHTLRFTPLDDAPCVVKYEFRPVEGGTEFVLTTTGVPPGTKTSKYMKQGGPFIAKTLKGCVEDGRPPFGSRVMLCLMKATAWMTPKRCNSEYWPLEKGTDGPHGYPAKK